MTKVIDKKKWSHGILSRYSIICGRYIKTKSKLLSFNSPLKKIAYVVFLFK